MTLDVTWHPERTFDVSGFKDIQFFIRAAEDNDKPTSFILDVITLTVQ
jgi:hypothetical protein